MVHKLLDRYVPEGKQFKQEIFFQSMQNWHLYGHFTDGYEDGGFIEYVRLFSIVGVLVLLIACVNFMNLSTARSEKRAREMGVRKAMGSLRRNLIAQFLIESLVITAIAACITLVLTDLSLPSFNLLTGSGMVIPWSSSIFWAVMAAYVLIIGLLAGSRPAFYLSSFQPVRVLKGSITAGRSASWPRKVLVVLQFTCSIALIISTFLIYQQVQYAKERPSGYNPNRLVMTDGSVDLDRNYIALRDELMQSGLVASITRSNSFVTGLWNWSLIQDWPGKQPNEAMSIRAEVRARGVGGQAVGAFCRAGDLYFLSGTFWTGGLYGRAADTGDRHQEGARRERSAALVSAVERFCGAGAGELRGGFAGGVLLFASLAVEIQLSYHDRAGCFSPGGGHGLADHAGDGECAGDTRGGRQPDEEPTGGIGRFAGCVWGLYCGGAGG